jgi:peptide deformylase
MIYSIVAYGDPVLRKEAEDITDPNFDVKKLAEDMFETMYNAHGVGLAAPQIGKPIRMFVLDGEPMDEENLKGFKKVFINPTIVEEDGEEWGFEEGCLSIPGINEEVFRQERVKIHYFDENWNEYEEVYDGMAARIIQHEYDHIDGVLFIDYLSGLKKRVLKGRLTNISKGKCEARYKMRFPKK